MDFIQHKQHTIKNWSTLEHFGWFAVHEEWNVNRSQARFYDIFPVMAGECTSSTACQAHESNTKCTSYLVAKELISSVRNNGNEVTAMDTRPSQSFAAFSGTTSSSHRLQCFR
jgi:hypothetical protein